MIRWTLLTTTLLVSMTGLAQAQAPPSDADWHRDWHHHRRYQKKEATTPSADNTVVKAGETRAIVDASGAAWTIANGVVNRNGVPAGYSAHVTQIAYVDGTVWQQNAAGLWWRWDGTGWPGYGTSTSPLPASAVPATAPAATTTAPAPAATTQAAGASPATASRSAPCGNSTTTEFGVLPVQQGGTGQIVDAKGNRFVPRGINIMGFRMSRVPSAATLKSLFPGINIVRLAIYHYNSPQELQPVVADLTGNGIVVILENHNNGAGNAGGGRGAVFTGALLQSENNWYASIASAFKGNPYVWFGTNNEPPMQPGLSQWQQATYNAIRGTGNNSPILLEAVCFASSGKPVCNQGYDPSAYAQMSNVAWDTHIYGWLTNKNTNQGVNDAYVAATVAALGGIKSAGNTTMPVFVGEYGNSTTGQTIDANGTQIVNAVQGAVLSGTAAGSAAWAWGNGNPGDGLTSGGGLSSYGRQVASYLAQKPPGFSVCHAASSTTPGTA